MAYKTISATLPETDLKYVNGLVEKGEYTGNSDLIRDAIRSLRRERGEQGAA